MENQGLPKAMVMGVVGLIFVVMFGSSMFVTINPGQKGVLFKTLGEGLDKDYVYGQGDNIGKNYLEKIIKPAVRSVTREVIGNYLPEELYSTKRTEIEQEIYDQTNEIVADKNINLPAIYIRDVTLPQTLKTAIEQKLKQEQESLEYEFKIDKARKEAERKEIEANGIAKFQKIVNQTITPQLLKWKGVEATQEIAKSSNAKVIVIGNGDGDLPIILGGQ